MYELDNDCIYFVLVERNETISDIYIYISVRSEGVERAKKVVTNKLGRE